MPPRQLQDRFVAALCADAAASWRRKSPRSMGEASQATATMVPGDPNWRFGLFGPGD